MQSCLDHVGALNMANPQIADTKPEPPQV